MEAHRYVVTDKRYKELLGRVKEELALERESLIEKRKEAVETSKREKALSRESARSLDKLETQVELLRPSKPWSKLKTYRLAD